MTATRASRPTTIYVLVGCLLFLSLGAFMGGISFLVDPTGAILGVPMSWLKGSPFPDFIIPGLFLLVVFAIAPLIISYGLLARPEWPLLGAVTAATREHWAWTGAVVVSVLLIVFEVVEYFSIQYFFFLQPVMAALALIMLALAFRPVVRKHYAAGAA